METEKVNHPKHYNDHPSGIECIQVVEHMGFNIGNAMKYLWRADLKGAAIEDLKKAAWYVQREIEKRGGVPQQDTDMVPAAMLEKLARAVMAECDSIMIDLYKDSALQRIALDAIIASVREGK